MLYVVAEAPVVVTLTEIIQLPLAAIVPFENESEVAPAAGEKVGVPQLVVVAFGVLATCILAGRGSVKLYPLIAPALGLVIVILKTEVPPTLTVLGLKLFEMETLVGSTMIA